VRVRQVTAEDAVAVAELCTQLGYPVGAEPMRRRIAALAGRDDHAVLVAESAAGRVVGWVHVCEAMLIEIDPTAEIWGLIVDESVRGQGFGRALMDAAEEWVSGRGLAMMRLRSRVQREGAHRFYERLGYRIAKTSHTFEKRLATTSPVTDR
jgi:ribosomal protein S18 acetylase RimI-like enzyme